MELGLLIAGLIFIPLIVAFVFKREIKYPFIKYLFQLGLFMIYPFIVFYFIDYWKDIP